MNNINTTQIRLKVIYLQQSPEIKKKLKKKIEANN